MDSALLTVVDARTFFPHRKKKPLCVNEPNFFNSSWISTVKSRKSRTTDFNGLRFFFYVISTRKPKWSEDHLSDNFSNIAEQLLFLLKIRPPPPPLSQTKCRRRLSLGNTAAFFLKQKRLFFFFRLSGRGFWSSNHSGSSAALCKHHATLFGWMHLPMINQSSDGGDHPNMHPIGRRVRNSKEIVPVPGRG